MLLVVCFLGWCSVLLIFLSLACLGGCSGVVPDLSAHCLIWYDLLSSIARHVSPGSTVDVWVALTGCGYGSEGHLGGVWVVGVLYYSCLALRASVSSIFVIRSCAVPWLRGPY